MCNSAKPVRSVDDGQHRRSDPSARRVAFKRRVVPMALVSATGLATLCVGVLQLSDAKTSDRIQDDGRSVRVIVKEVRDDFSSVGRISGLLPDMVTVRGAVVGAPETHALVAIKTTQHGSPELGETIVVKLDPEDPMSGEMPGRPATPARRPALLMIFGLVLAALFPIDALRYIFGRHRAYPDDSTRGSTGRSSHTAR